MSLQRGGPLARKTVMSPGEPLPRGGPLARTKPAPRMTAVTVRTTGRKTPRKTGPTVQVRATVHARDLGCCVRCGLPARDLDHRRGRGAGGTKGDESARINQPAWLLTLCGVGNTSGCHGLKESDRQLGEREGFRLPRNGVAVDAAHVPVLTFYGWGLFDNDGGFTFCPPPPGGDARNAASELEQVGLGF